MPRPKSSQISPEHYYYQDLIPTTTEGLAPTALVQDRAFTHEDPARVRTYLVKAAAQANPSMFPNFWETTLLASLYARELTERIQPDDLTPPEAEALNLIHDLGRLVSPGQYYRNDLLADRLEARAGVRKEELAKLPDIGRILGLRGESIMSIEDLTPAQRILHVSDWLGKRAADGSLVTPAQIIEASSKSMIAYKHDAVWPSTNAGMKAIAGGKKEVGEELFRSEVEWVQSQGIDWDEVREAVEHKIMLPESQNWIQDAQHAHAQSAPK